MIDLMDIQNKFLEKKFNKWEIFEHFINESLVSIYKIDDRLYEYDEYLKIICIELKNCKIYFCLDKEKKIRTIF